MILCWSGLVAVHMLPVGCRLDSSTCVWGGASRWFSERDFLIPIISRPSCLPALSMGDNGQFPDGLSGWLPILEDHLESQAAQEDNSPNLHPRPQWQRRTGDCRNLRCSSLPSSFSLPEQVLL